MSLHGCKKVMKWFLIIFNALILCAGAIAIGLGAWGLASEYGAEKMMTLTGSEFYRGTAIAIIVGGSVMVVISLFGFIGALMENRVLLGFYFIIVLLLLILFVVATVLAFVYRDALAENIKTEMTDTLLYQYGVNQNVSDNYDVTTVWDDLQQSLECCGVQGRLPYSENSWFLWQSSDWFHSQMGTQKEYVPSSCCSTKYPNNTCNIELNTDKTKPLQDDLDLVTTENPEIYYKGCYDQLMDEIRSHILAIAGIALAIVITMFLCLLFSICVCASIGSNKMII